MIEPDRLRGPVGVANRALDWFAGCQVAESDQVDAIVLLNGVVVRRVAEREREQTLLFEVAFMNAGKAPGDDRHPAEQPRR